MKLVTSLNSIPGLLALLVGFSAFSQVNQISVKRIPTSQAFTSAVPVKMLFDSGGQLYAAGQGIDGSLVMGKYSASGAELWQRSYQGASSPRERPVALALDALGNLLVTAVSRGSNDDFLTLKLDPLGQPAWTNRLNGVGDGDDTPAANAVDAAGNVYVTGNTYVSATVIIQGTIVTRAVTTVSYAPNGQLRWSADYQPTFGGRKADAIVADECGRVFVSGMSTFFPDPRAPADEFVVLALDATNGASREIYAADTANGSGMGGETRLTIAPGCGLVFAGRRPAGLGPSFIRVVRFGNDSLPLWSNGITLDGLFPSPGLSGLQMGPDGSTYASAFARDAGFFVPTNGLNYRVARFSTAGVLAWNSVYDGPGFRDDVSSALLTDAAGDAYVCGTSGLSNDQIEWATVKTLPDGTRAWVARYGSSTNANFRPLAMRLDARGALFVAGTAPGPSGDGTDLIVVKYVEPSASITRTGDHKLRLNFVGAPGATNRLQAALHLPDWRDLATLIADEDGAVSFETEMDPGSGATFFRTVSP